MTENVIANFLVFISGLSIGFVLGVRSITKS